MFCYLCPSVTQAQASTVINDLFCAKGSLKQIYEFFLNEGLLVMADGVRMRANREPATAADVLFLIDRELNAFHVVKIKPHATESQEACVFISAREVDIQLSLPSPQLLAAPIHREHTKFTDQIPETGECPSDKITCVPWPVWKHLLRHHRILCAYVYSAKWEYDAYHENVSFTLDGKNITTTRGKLAAFARLKYAARERDEIKESAAEKEKALKLYRKIYEEVDHGHPLLVFWISDNQQWAISVIDRKQGLVWTPMQGKNLRQFPLDARYYSPAQDE